MKFDYCLSCFLLSFSIIFFPKGGRGDVDASNPLEKKTKNLGYYGETTLQQHFNMHLNFGMYAQHSLSKTEFGSELKEKEENKQIIKPKQLKTFSLIWITDPHLDILYDPNESTRNHCRIPTHLVLSGKNKFSRTFKSHLIKRNPNAFAETNPILGRAGCDTPVVLVEKTLRFAAFLAGKNKKVHIYRTNIIYLKN